MRLTTTPNIVSRFFLAIATIILFQINFESGVIATVFEENEILHSCDTGFQTTEIWEAPYKDHCVLGIEDSDDEFSKYINILNHASVGINFTSIHNLLSHYPILKAHCPWDDQNCRSPPAI